MRKVLSVMLTVVLVVAMAFAFTGCGGIKADYESPMAAVQASRNGENIIGKTVTVTATMNFTALPDGTGMIYTDVNVAGGFQVTVCPDTASGSSVAQGDEVVFMIQNVRQNVPGNYNFLGKIVG